MKATITYEVSWVPHPWDDKKRAAGMYAWCVLKVVTPEAGPRKNEAVAIFNLDSEAETFIGHVFATGLNGQLVTIPDDFVELFRRR